MKALAGPPVPHHRLSVVTNRAARSGSVETLAPQCAIEDVAGVEEAVSSAIERTHAKLRLMTYQLRREGASQNIIADSLEDAMTAARDWAAAGSKAESSTAWAHAILVATDDYGKQKTYRITATIDPKEPQCLDGEDHDWQSPIRLVGGIKANPGVFGHGGGVIIARVCMRCGCGKLTDTWAQDPGTRRLGLTAVTYAQGKYADQIEQQAAF